MPVQRLRLRDLLLSRLPNLIGICGADVSRIADAVNTAQERLLTCREAGEEGWYGGYAEMVFNVSRNAPYLRLPRGVARLISVDACDTPVPIRNQFYEYLEFGDGHWPKTLCGGSEFNCCLFGHVEALRRNMAATFLDIGTSRKGLRIYPSEAADVGTNRVFVGGLDANGVRLQTQDGNSQVQGVFVNLDYPFVDLKLPLTVAQLEISAIDTILKDKTLGYVRFYEIDLDTGVQRLILTMEPSEEVAGYASYYLKEIPQGCCQSSTQNDDSLVQVTAMVKLDLVPAVVDSDPLLIQSKEAIIAECQAVHLGDQELAGAKQQAVERHLSAVRYLRGQQRHYEGRQHIAVDFAPFGHARLTHQTIGGMR